MESHGSVVGGLFESLRDCSRENENNFVDDRLYKNSSGDEIANVNFYAVRPEATRIR